MQMPHTRKLTHRAESERQDRAHLSPTHMPSVGRSQRWGCRLSQTQSSSPDDRKSTNLI